MNKLVKKEKINLVVPVLIGVAVAAGLTWFFLADETADLRGKLADNAGKGWDTVKEKLPFSADDIDAFKEKVKETAASVVSSAKGQAEDAVDRIEEYRS